MSIRESVGPNVKALLLLKKQIADIEKQIESLEGAIKEVMVATDTYEFEGDDWKVTWNMVASNRFSQKLFAADHPKLFEKYKVISESRRFLVN